MVLPSVAYFCHNHLHHVISEWLKENLKNLQAFLAKGKTSGSFKKTKGRGFIHEPLSKSNNSARLEVMQIEILKHILSSIKADIMEQSNAQVTMQLISLTLPVQSKIKNKK
eukprot:TRINITY_DN47420_c0_g1_i1.p1 TRINITY_DN47420_c0_g1~~TRINITY_DN47420_c0_g1_i1.p1  ORF type:complete len:111 (-),score=7.14 TRINITY_DN47420_c0_g1_i1:54-386(-)